MKNSLKQKIKNASVIIFALAYLLLSFPATAATVKLRALATQVKSGATFTLSVDLDTQGKTINNTEAVITYPTDLVTATAINTSGSIFSMWVEQPAFSNEAGTISFNGGVPNPGFTGSSGHILSIQFKSVVPGTANFTFSSAAIRENDGLGTDILSGQTNASLSITEQATEPTPPGNTPPTTQTVTITSPTHPDSTKWYNQTSATFAWKLPAGTTASQTSLDATQGTTPRILRQHPISTISVPDLKDGVWYFNARFLTAGSWTKIYTYKIQVDTTAPDSLVINQASTDSAILYPTLSAHDTTSGIDFFTAQVDGAEPIKITPAGDQTPINIPNITPGNHEIIASVYDLAGNSTSTKATVEFKQPSKITLDSYTKEIKEGQRIEATGTGPTGSNINVTLLTEDGISRVYTTTTNGNGQFSFRSEPISGGGTYTMWAESGDHKLTSQKVTINVVVSSGSKLLAAIKSSAKYFTSSNIIIFFLSILCLLGWLNYFALKRSIKQKENSKKNQK